ncbi:MAG: nucleoside phosphorylase [Desulfurococcales archaeon]|nr:nucleoside phosphorylase [Desulfurococcales archaeon]
MRRRPLHIKLRGELPDTVFIMGDPGRVRLLSKELRHVEILNEERGYLVVSGATPRGDKIALASHGIGGPSLLIAVEELFMYGGKKFIRLGTAGGFSGKTKLLDVVVASASSMIPGTCGLSLYTQKIVPPLAASPYLLQWAVNALKSSPIEFRIAPVFCSDSFYAETPGILEDASRLGALAVEMETAALYALAGIRGFEALSVLVISNVIGSEGEVYSDPSMLADRIVAVFRALISNLDKL